MRWQILVPLGAVAAAIVGCGLQGLADYQVGADLLSSEAGAGDTCTTASDCTAPVPETTPPGCAEPKCVDGKCVISAKDADGDGYGAAACKALSEGVRVLGDDCDDTNPDLNPGHGLVCDPREGGVDVPPSGIVCGDWRIRCNADGSVSSCAGGNVCISQACVAGTCAGVCAPGSVQCATSGNGVQTCQSDGTWGAPVDCVGQACSGGTCGGACAPTQKRCTDKQPEICDASGTWGNSGSTCAYVCDPGSGQCGGECLPGSKQCSATQPQLCDANGHWQDSGAACSGGTPFCALGSCGACQPGVTRSCGNCGSQTCLPNGSWDTCGGQGVCAANAQVNCSNPTCLTAAGVPIPAGGTYTCTPQCGSSTCQLKSGTFTLRDWSTTDDFFFHYCGSGYRVDPATDSPTPSCAMVDSKYLQLPAGNYDVTFTAASGPGGKVDFYVRNAGNNTNIATLLGQSLGPSQIYVLPFTLISSCTSQIEIIVRWQAGLVQVTNVSLIHK